MKNRTSITFRFVEYDHARLSKTHLGMCRANRRRLASTNEVTEPLNPIGRGRFMKNGASSLLSSTESKFLSSFANSRRTIACCSSVNIFRISPS